MRNWNIEYEKELLLSPCKRDTTGCPSWSNSPSSNPASPSYSNGNTLEISNQFHALSPQNEGVGEKEDRAHIPAESELIKESAFLDSQVRATHWLQVEETVPETQLTDEIISGSSDLSMTTLPSTSYFNYDMQVPEFEPNILKDNRRNSTGSLDDYGNKELSFSVFNTRPEEDPVQTPIVMVTVASTNSDIPLSASNGNKYLLTNIEGTGNPIA